MPAVPKIESYPMVPDGGFGPNENEIRRASLSNQKSNGEDIENEEVCTENDHFFLTLRDFFIAL